MKVTGRGSGVTPEATAVTGRADEVGERQGAGFAEKLGSAAAARPSGQTAAAGAVARGTVAAGVPAPGTVSEIGAELQAGRITAEVALERIINRVLDRQLGASAPSAVREKVGAALRQALEDDPVLAGKVRALGDR